MRLLITTQTVDLDDPILSFFHRWLEEFAKRCECVHVICLKKGKYNLPSNVFVHSLGKPAFAMASAGAGGFLLRIKYISRFYRHVFSLRNDYDAVFVHMNPEYVALGGLFWRLMGRRIVLWYTHRQRSLKLYVGLLLAHRVVTAAKESLTITSAKVDVIGHGIDAARFSAHPLKKIARESPKVVAVGRITPIKNLEVAIGAIARLRIAGIHATLDLIGEPISESDRRYEAHLRNAAQKLGDSISFLGPISNQKMSGVYPQFDLALNLCPTGGIDKAVLESMAAGVPTVVSNEAFRSYFGRYDNDLIAQYRDAGDVAEKIRALAQRKDIANLQSFLREHARQMGDVSRVVSAIMERLYGPSSASA